eukprot:58741_1
MTQYGINVNLARVGWDVFSDSDTRSQDITTTTYNEMVTFITNIWYDRGVSNLAGALQRTQTAFENARYNAQKINIIIMGTNPYVDGTTTQEVCQYALDIKKLGVRVVFVGIGNTWQQERIDCLVGDISTDVIAIENYDSLHPYLSNMYDVLCPTDKKIKITEVKPVSTTNARYIEFYNMGMQIESSDTLELSGLVDGEISGVTIPQGKYFVVYDSDNGIVTCSDCGSEQCTVNTDTNLCDEAIYIGLDTFDDDMDMEDWDFEISDGNSNIFDSVQYNQNNYWPKVQDDYSYSLDYIGYNNQYGANYARSCNNEGTPGAPTRTCTGIELQCQVSEDCQYSGDTTALCSGSDNTCICTANSGFYPKQGSCYPIPEPSNCVANIIKNGTQPLYTRFTFTGANIESINEQYSIRYYQLCYPNTNGENCMTTVTDYSRIKRQSDLIYIPNQGQTLAGYAFTRITQNGGTWDSIGWQTNCTIITPSPTLSPSPSPTNAPTTSPTNAPTNSPTWQSPKIFLSGDFCDRDRCGCNKHGYDCCILTDLGANCTHQQREYTVGDVDRIFHSVKVVPEGFPYATLIHWRVNFNGTVRQIIPTHNIMIDNITDDNPLKITVQPRNGSVWINGSTSINVPLVLNESEIICPNNNTDCKRDLFGLTAIFKFELYNCSTMNIENFETDCDIIYPSILSMIISRSDTGGGSGTGGEEGIDTWIWIVLIVLGVFLILLSWLLYKYWYKGRKQSEDYAVIKDDIEFQKKHNDEDIETQLENADTNFNPLATGMPGVDKTHDPLSIERQKRADSQQNDMVEPDAVKTVFKEEMGPIAGKQTSVGMKEPLLRG